MAGVAFLAASPAPGETGDHWVSGYEEKASCASCGMARVWSPACHSSCQPWLPGLPALPSMAPVCPGTAPLDMLVFPVRQPKYWGIYVIYPWSYWRFWPRKNLIPVREDLQVYVLTTFIVFFTSHISGNDVPHLFLHCSSSCFWLCCLRETSKQRHLLVLGVNISSLCYARLGTGAC